MIKAPLNIIKGSLLPIRKSITYKLNVEPSRNQHHSFAVYSIPKTLITPSTLKKKKKYQLITL